MIELAAWLLFAELSAVGVNTEYSTDIPGYADAQTAYEYADEKRYSHETGATPGAFDFDCDVFAMAAAEKLPGGKLKTFSVKNSDELHMIYITPENIVIDINWAVPYEYDPDMFQQLGYIDNQGQFMADQQGADHGFGDTQRLIHAIVADVGQIKGSMAGLGTAIQSINDTLRGIKDLDLQIVQTIAELDGIKSSCRRQGERQESTENTIAALKQDVSSAKTGLSVAWVAAGIAGAIAAAIFSYMLHKIDTSYETVRDHELTLKYLVERVTKLEEKDHKSKSIDGKGDPGVFYGAGYVVPKCEECKPIPVPPPAPDDDASGEEKALHS